jgi:hypothetical protein
VLEELGSGCPLCGEAHRARYHCFAARTYRTESVEGTQKVVSRVPRIFCEINCRIRKETGERKQYTLTVLPSFLIPYSRIPVETVHEALDGYIRGTRSLQIGAALRMQCLSASSFRLFYRRVCERLGMWVLILARPLSTFAEALGEVLVGEPERKKLRDQWQCFLALSLEHVRLNVRPTETALVGQKFLRPYIYAVLSRHYRGLGP